VKLFTDNQNDILTKTNRKHACAILSAPITRASSFFSIQVIIRETGLAVNFKHGTLGIVLATYAGATHLEKKGTNLDTNANTHLYTVK